MTLRVDTIERAALPQWIAQRLAAQGQRVPAGDAGQKALAFFADRVEGNLLAAHQEIIKLGLLYGSGELSFEQIEAAVLNVARYDVFKLGEAVLAGQVARTLRMLDGLQAEGEAAVLVHCTLADDILALKRVKDALAAGRRCRWRCARTASGAPRSACSSACCRCLTEHALAELVEAASVCDGLVKGLKHPALARRPLGRAATPGADGG